LFYVKTFFLKLTRDVGFVHIYSHSFIFIDAAHIHLPASFIAIETFTVGSGWQAAPFFMTAAPENLLMIGFSLSRHI